MNYKILIATCAVSLVLGTAAYARDVRVGTEGKWPPFNFVDSNGNLIGFEIDAAKSICKVAGWNCTFVAQDWDGIIPALNNGRYDLIMAAMSINDQRRKVVDFSKPYGDSPTKFIALKNSPFVSAKTVDDIARISKESGAVIAVQRASIQDQMFQSLHVSVKTYEDSNQLELELTAGRVGVVAADSTGFTQRLIKGPDGDKFQEVGPSITGADYPQLGEGIGAAFRKADADLATEFNAALKVVQEDGSLKKLSIQWFGYDIVSSVKK